MFSNPLSYNSIISSEFKNHFSSIILDQFTFEDYLKRGGHVTYGDWDHVLRSTSLTEEFLSKYINIIKNYFLGWDIIISYQTLSEEFLLKHVDSFRLISDLDTLYPEAKTPRKVVEKILNLKKVRGA